MRSMISNPARGHSFRAAFVGTNDEAAGPERPPSPLLVWMHPHVRRDLARVGQLDLIKINLMVSADCEPTSA